MKNIFNTPKARATALDIKTQELPTNWSPKARLKGLGFGLAFIMKDLGYTPFEIADTNSMLPLFDADHLLYCESTGTEGKIIVKLDLYDVCIYEDLSGALIVHRITKTDYVANRYYFKGDNNLFGDGWIPRDRIKYRVSVISYVR